MASKPSLLQLLLFLASDIFSTSLASPVPEHEWEPWGSASVNTTSGDITGHTSSYSGVYEYLGIPYAQPPLGTLRFAPPTPYNANGPIMADKQPLSCIQAPSTINYSEPLNWQHISLDNGIFANHTSEDCLYLNVWTRPRIPKQGLKPVMIWFYGGGFHSGGISDPAEQGGIFTYEGDVVFISVNYRLGIFGFSGIPGLSQNVGFLDQRLAVEWVRNNAEAFGGDPQRIMIFGHSAGGSSVDYYNYAWVDDPIIAASSPMSGSVDNFGRRYPNITAAGWYETSKLLDCGTLNTTDDATILSCVQNKPAPEVLHASENATKIVASMLSAEAQVYIGITGLFGPTIDNKTVFANYTDRASEGQIAHVPALIGENTDEGCFFAQKDQIPVSDEALVTKSTFVCPGAWAALWRTKNSIPVWKYSWEGFYPNLYAPACPGKPWHGLEVYVLFNSTAEITGQPATADEVAAGAYMRKAWTTFARDPIAGLTSRLQWPTLNSDESNVVQLAPTNSTGFRIGSAVATDALCYTKYTKSHLDYSL